jgi:hypothetical protein
MDTPVVAEVFPSVMNSRRKFREAPLSCRDLTVPFTEMYEVVKMAVANHVTTGAADLAGELVTPAEALDLKAQLRQEAVSFVPPPSMANPLRHIRDPQTHFPAVNEFVHQTWSLLHPMIQSRGDVVERWQRLRAPIVAPVIRPEGVCQRHRRGR